MEKFIPEARYVEVEFDPFSGPVIQRTAPTTEAQREVWVASQISREASCAYIESVTLVLKGALDPGHVQSAITYLVQRHEGLRSTISANGLHVIVAEQMHIPQAYSDLSTLDTEERQAQLRSIDDKDMELPFDLLNGPLFRTHLIRVGAEEHQLRLTGHHVMLDGWSIGIVMGDISRAYSAYAAGRQPQLPPAHRFTDYALAQIDLTAGKDFEEVERYWLDLFKGPVPRLDLPTDRPRPQQKTFASRRLDLDLDPILTQRLREMSTRSGTSLVTTLLTCFELLVYRLTGDSDLCIGLPAAGQNDFGMKELVGHCVNLLALRSTVDGEQPFIDHLKERRGAMLDASDNQKYTFGTLVRKLNVPREPGRIPLCPVVFNIDMDMDSEVAFHGLEHRVISNPRKYENFELFLNVTGKGSSLVLEWSYNTDLFEEETIRSWMAQLTVLIEQVGKTPEVRIKELAGDTVPAGVSMLPPAEWLGTFTDYPKVDIPTLFAQVAGQYPDNIAVELEDEKITYRELLKRSTTLAHALVGMGVRPGDPVGVCTDRVVAMVIGKLAILQAGGCYVPFDPTYPADRLAFMFKDSEVKVLLTQRHLLPQLPPHDARTIFPEEINGAESGVLPRMTADAAAYIMYTSGSTGTPKGVVVPHRGIVRLVRNQFYVPFGPDLTWLQISNVSFDLCTLEIWGALLNGGRCVLQPQMRPSLSEISDTINRHKVTSVWLTTGLFNLMVDEQLDQLKGLRHIIAGGDVLSVAHVKKALAALGPNVLINGYGPTENTTFTTCFPINEEADIGRSIPIGIPLSNTTVHILDEDRKPVPIGRQGLLWTGGDGVALGYWNRPELTAERFIRDPFSNRPNALLYNTGDLAQWLPDGTIEFIGRADGQVKVRGFRVELGEIEKAVNEIPEVKDKVVVVGQSGGTKTLTCYFVPQAGDVIGDTARETKLIKTVRESLGKRLPEYMMPTAFMPIAAIPLTGNGKVDRRALPEPVAHASSIEAEQMAPTTAGERELAEIWKRVLGVSDIGIHDNFFDLGGHSLLGIQMLSAVRSAFNVELSLLSVFEAPTLSALAELISSTARPARTPILPVPKDGELEVSFGQQRLWMSAQFGRDAYDMSQAVRISGELDVNTLARALDALVARHETLRTTFETTPAGRLLQRIHPPEPGELTVESVPSIEDAIARCQQEGQRPFDLVTGPLFEPLLYRITDHDHLLLLRMHHIVGDEWSIGVLFRDLGAFYQGQEPEPLRFSYADFAAWQRAQITEEVAQSELSYWQTQLAGAPALLDLPTDLPRPSVLSTNGALRTLRLPTTLWRSLEAIGRQQQATPFMTLLAGFYALLHRYAGATDISIGTPIASRDQPGSEDLVGFFLNTLVLRTDLSGTPSFIDLLARVRSVALGAFLHQDLPFERVVEALAPERTRAHAPLFQVSFVYQPNEAPPSAPGLAFEQVGFNSDTSKFDLTLAIAPGPDGLDCTLEYSTDLFDPETIGRMLGHFRILLEGIVADPLRSISEYPLVAPAERLLITEWSGGLSPYPHAAMDELFDRVTAQYPDRVAVQMDQEKLSYAALQGHVNTLAAELAKRGLRHGEPVGVCMDRSIGTQTAMLAILRAGGCYVPFDLSYPEERVRYMLEDAQVKFMLTQAHLAGEFPGCEDRIILLDNWGRSGEMPFTDAPPPARLHDADSPAYIIYTSGSTGMPKGVVVPHRAVVRLVRDQNYVEFSSSLVILQISNLCFDGSVFEIWGALLNGGRLVVQPQQKPTLQEIVDNITRHKVNTACFTSGLFNLMVDEHVQDLNGLKYLLAGGDALSVPHVKRALQVLGPGVLINGYGPTENADYTTCHAINDLADLKIRVPIGRPIANTTVHILDAGMNPVPVGIKGELFTGGDGIAIGYWQRPELTAERFIDDPFSTAQGAKLYRTGDLARWRPDGTVDFLGRIDGQVKVRGFRVELGEIENAISAITQVKDRVVITRNDVSGQKQLVAYLVPKHPEVEDPEDLITSVRNHLRKVLPEYMVPLAFMVLPKLPLTGNGKVDRRALPAPELDASARAAYEAPAGEVEQALAEIWSRILRVEQVGRNDNFFDLGGHSLLGIQILAAIRSAFNVELTLSSIFEAQTLADLAEAIFSTARPARTPILPVPKDGELEVSFGQQRLWMSAQFGRDAYDMSQAVRISGELDVNTLARALDALVARHETLRTTFETTPAGRLLQRIHPPEPGELTVESVPSIEDAIARCQQEGQRPFDLVTGPLFEPLLYRITDHDHLLLLRMHHIVGDEWSIGVLFRDLGAFYQGQEPEPLRFSYADFAAWQRAQITEEVAQSELSYWQTQLAGAPALLDLPTDLPRPSVLSTNGALRTLRLPTTLWRSLEAIGRQQQATPFMTLLAGFYALLHRYAGATDISIGTPIASRDQPGSEDLVGFFLNTLVLRTDLSGTPSFIDLLARVRSVALGAFLHQDLPFERVVEALAPGRTLAHAPLFQVMFIYQSNEAPPSAPGLAFEQVGFNSDTSKFDLTFLIAPGPDGLDCTLEYSTDLFDPETIGRMLGHFRILLEGIVADPLRSISEYPLMAPAERHLLLTEWNGGLSPYPRDRGVGQIFQEVATAHPERTALELGEKSMSYGELLARAQGLCAHLVTTGVKPGDPVVLCMDRSLDMITAHLAILQAGACYVPIDPSYPPERLTFMLEDSGARTIISQRHLLSALPGHQAKVVLPEELDLVGMASSPSQAVGGGDDAAYIMYTSGSTGRPKGVVVPHRGIVRLVKDQNYLDFGPDLVFLQLSTISFDLSTLEIWGALLNGAKLVLQPQQKPSLSEITKVIKQQGVTTVWFTVGLFNLLVDDQLDNLRSLRHILVGGDVLSVPHIKRAFRALGPGVLINGYGPTENTTFTTCLPIDDASAIKGSVPIGRPLNNTTVYVLDEKLKPVPIGHKGELYTGGDGVALGYWKREDLTNERFILDPYSIRPGAKLYKTGDMVRWLPNGTVEFIGRSDDQVKVRGFRIELGEIENAISQLVEVKDNVVVVRKDLAGEKQLVAYVVPQARDAANDIPQEALIGTVREHLRSTMPAYMLPTAFMVLDALPLNANGKVDKHTLPAPELDASARAAYEAPAGEVEQALAEIWSRILNVDRVGRHDNFFDLGGQSLVGMQILAAIRSAFNVELTLSSIFEAQTLADLAEVISSTARPARTPILPVPREGELEVSFGQQRLWMSAQFGRDAYDMSQAVRISGELDVNTLARALDALVARHETLRTTFETTPAGRLLQRIHPPEPGELTVESVPSIEEAIARCQQEGQRPFDLVTGPLFEPLLYRITDHDHLLLLRMHHIVGDEWSIGVLFRDLGAFYQGQEPEPLRFSYADFAAWQRAQITEEVAQSELSYWQAQLAGAPALLDLPTDLPRPSVLSTNGALRTLRLPTTLWRSLEAIGRQQQATPFMTLLAGFYALLHRYAGATDISIGTPIASRDQPGSEDLVGFFLNTLVLRTDLSGTPSFIDLLTRVRSVALGAFLHQDLPFERVVEALAPERTRAHAPLFQVLFIYQPDEAAPAAPGLAFEHVGISSSTSKFDLTLAIAPGPDGLDCTLEYSTDLFDAATIDRMLGHFRILLEAIVSDPALSIGEHPLLDPAEARTLAALQPVPTPAHGAQLMHAGFMQQASDSPDSMALNCGGEPYSYRQLEERSNQIAHALRARGIGRGDLVGLCLERGPDMLYALLAVLKSGAAYVPLDPGFPKARLDHYAQDARLALLLTSSLVDTAPRDWCADADRRVLMLDRDGSWQNMPSTPLPPDNPLDAGPQDAAYVIYTSGSTGKPKGVVVPHRAVANFLRSMRREPGINANDRLVAVTTLSFDISVLEIMLPLCAGAAVVLADRETAVDGHRLAELLNDSGATMMQATPSTWRMLIEAGWKGGSGFRALCGGEGMPPKLARALLERCGELWNLYGPTETTVWSTCARITRSGENTDVHIGRPIDNTSVWILDDQRQPCPLGVPGEICIGGTGVALGYLDRPELTADRFVTVPIGGVDTLLYRTGDRGRWRNNATLEHLGRMDFQVKVRGYRIELGEIEARCDEAPGVERSIVITREDRTGDVRLAAYLVLKEPDRFDAAALRKHLSATLPQYMMPQHILVLDALPLLPNGKIDRKALPAPDPEDVVRAVYEAPAGEVEQAVAEIWGRLLGVEQVGRNDNFFELGGQSLVGMQILAAIRSAFNIELPLSSIFEAQTLADLAEAIFSTARPARTPILPVPREGELEVSFGQQRLWMSAQFGRDAYDMSQAVRISGELDVNTLARALDALVARHETLRTTFETTPAGRLLQRIHPPEPGELTVESVPSIEDAIARCQQEGQRPFDLVTGPLFEPLLYRITDHDHLLLLRMHHIVGDEWSIGVLFRDLGAFYQGQEPEPLRFSYADFAAWQRAQITEEVAQSELSYWQTQLAGAPALLDLPTDLPRPSVLSTNGALRTLRLPTTLWRSLEAIGRQQQATPFMTLLAGFYALLHRYAGATDISIGTPIASRDQPGSEDLVGFFLNTLVLRTDLSGTPSFIDLLARVRSVALGAFLHQDLPFERVVEALAPERTRAHAPLFQVSFVYQPNEAPPSAPGLAFEQVGFNSDTSKFDLTLAIAPGPDGLDCTLEYSTDLFDPETIGRMLGHFRILLEGIVADPLRSISEYPLVAPAERLLITEWSGGLSPYPHAAMDELFDRVTAQYPDRVAVQMDQEKFSYAALQGHVNTLAAELAKRGLRHGEPVGVCMDRSIGTQTAMLAILRAGGCYVPFDLSYPEERVRYMLEDAQVKFMLTQAHLAGEFPGCEDRIILLDNWGRSGEMPFTDAPPPARLHDADSPAYIIYTSGSTGMPKGVVVPHRAVVRLVRDQNYVEFSSSLVILQISNLCFDGSVFEIWGALLNGGRLVVQPQQKPTLQEIVDNITRHKVNTACFTSGLFNLMVDEHVQDLNGLKYLLAGGDALSVPHVKRALQVLGPGVLINGYGPTENADYTTCHAINDLADLKIRVPIGRPIANTTVHILDAGMNPVPVGIKGELFTGGDGIAIGYWQRPELTAERFIDDPFSTAQGAKLYRTGDLARWRPDGTVDFLGRIDGQVKVRGFRVELGEIENAISAITQVKDRVVITRNDVSGQKQLVAYLVPKHPEVEDPEDLITSVRNHLRKVLPEYMVPLAFMVLPKLPLTGNGKVDRRALPAPELDASARAAYEAPAGEVEQALAEIWSRILRVEQVGRNDNFFDLGGHSLLGIQILAAIRSAFNVELTLSSIFEAQTLADLAEAIFSTARPARTPILPVPRGGELEVSFGQQRLWMSAQFGRDAYDMSQAVRISGELDVNTLARALDALVARHETLRTTFETTPAGRLLQRIHPPEPAELTVETVPSIEDAIARCQQEGQRPFDLVTGPLFEPLLYRITDHDHLLLLRMHHIVGDEWSIGVLFRDLGAFYQGQEPEPLRFSYADFAAWQRAQITEEVAQSELSYWQAQLAGAPALLDLPTDLPRPSVLSTNGALRTLRLPTTLWRSLEAIGRQQQATPFMTLLAGFYALLHRYAGATDISIGTPIASRDQPGSEDLVGFFLNTLVLRTDLSGTPSFIDLLARVRSVALGAFLHQDLPFERVVEALAPERTRAHAPLFQVSFVYQPNEAPPAAPELAFEQVGFNSDTSKFDLTLAIAPGPDGLDCTLEYSTDLFDAATIDRMLGHFRILLEGIVADPLRSISEYPLVAPAERLLITEWSGGLSPYPHAAMDELFDRVTAQYPDRVAVQMDQEKLSYAALQGHVNTLAAELAKRGLRHGEPVGVCMDRSIGTQTAMLAILRAGGCYVPFDLSYPEERVRYMLEDAQVKFMLTQAHLAGEFPGCEDRIILLDNWGRSGEMPFTDAPPPARLHDADSPAYIIYTSGSTGMPKGVVVPHRAVVRLVRDQNYVEFSSSLVILQISNLCFDGSVFEIWGALLNGGRLVVQPQQKPTLQEIVDNITRHKVNTACFTSGLFNLMVDEHVQDLNGLKYLLAGGDALSVPHVKRALQVLGPGVLINGYGPTENADYTTCHAINDLADLKIRVPIGRPIANTTVHILDAGMNPVPVGIKGELFTGGDGIAIGYWQRPELTAERFIDDPFSTAQGAKLYRTGDLARWRPDGTVDFLGRIDGQVKVRGFRVELGEIENAISAITQVKDRVVITRNDASGQKQLVAYLVPKHPEVEDPEDLTTSVRNHLRKVLPEYMVPLAFVVLPKLPLTGNGKIDRRALPAPELDASARAAYEAPAGEVEQALAEIWSRILRVEQVGRNDNFFDLGGHSLLGIQLLARVEQQFGKAIPLNNIFLAPTVAQMAELLDAGRDLGPVSLLIPLQPEGTRPPLVCVHGDEANNFLPKYLGNDQPFYAISHQGEDGLPIVYNTVKEIARHYIHELMSVRAEGPYVLCGYSFGGIVAFEMARQLTAAGFEVPMVAMFDTYSPKMYLDLMHKYRELYAPLKRLIMRLLVKMEQARGRITNPKLRHFHIIDTYDKAIADYEPLPYDGPVTMYKAAKSTGSDDLGWAELATQLSIRKLPGDHHSLIKEPEVQLLARGLTADIDLVLRKSAAEAV